MLQRAQETSIACHEQVKSSPPPSSLPPDPSTQLNETTAAASLLANGSEVSNRTFACCLLDWLLDVRGATEAGERETSRCHGQ
eukprot:31635-Hanusia_phi.AAC.2